MNAAALILFDKSQWRSVCETAARDAEKRCGLSQDLYVTLFSEAIDSKIQQLPEEHRKGALQMAGEWDYATPREREETLKWNADNGCCVHGFNRDYCPQGCGE